MGEDAHGSARASARANGTRPAELLHVVAHRHLGLEPRRLLLSVRKVRSASLPGRPPAPLLPAGCVERVEAAGVKPAIVNPRIELRL